jgi:threonine dehydrogenase-like Zn-dependent dehydrogenase
VPRELSRVAVLVEPLTIAEKALIQLHHLQQRLPWACQIGGDAGRRTCHTAVVLGAGPVGLLGAMAFAAHGYRTAVYSKEERASEKAQIVDSIGAEYLAADDVPIDRLADAVGEVDVIYEAVGASSLAFRAIASLGTNGVFVFTGVPGRKGKVEVDTDRLMRDLVLKNQVLLGTVNASEDAFDSAIRDLAIFQSRWGGALERVIRRYPVEAHRELLEQGGAGIKNVLGFAE